MPQRRSDETTRANKRSPLLLKAAAEGQTIRVKYLLEVGVDLDYKDKEGLTALHHAVLHGFEDTTEVLIDDGSDVNCSSNVHGTPLCLAALKARNNVIRLLLKARASLSARESHLGSALHYACISGEATTVELLLDAGAEPNGRAAMHMPGTT